MRGAITGVYTVSSNAFYGYVRAPNGHITTFEAPGAGAGPFQGTAGGNINPAGEISGPYVDATLARHGYVRAANGKITEFDPPGDGTGAHQGVYTSFFYGLNPAGELVGLYSDSSDVFHGYVRAPNGSIATFDVPGAGAGDGQGTFAFGINPSGATTGRSQTPTMCITASCALATALSRPSMFQERAPALGQGTSPNSIDPSGAITGFFADGNNVNHGFVRDF